MWSLSSVPNGWFRVAGGLNGVAEETVNRQAWNAIYAQHHANSHWRDRNVNGMFNQYECHSHCAFWKSAFNLEPNRPNPGFNTYLTKSVIRSILPAFALEGYLTSLYRTYYLAFATFY